MTARLLDGGDGEVCGVLTSGGTESIIVAARAHRNFFREVTLANELQVRMYSISYPRCRIRRSVFTSQRSAGSNKARTDFVLEDIAIA